MRHTVIMLSEVAAAGTMLPRDFLAPAGRSCCFCGLTPANVTDRRRTQPASALLEAFAIDQTDPLLRTLYRCRNRDGCERRRRIVRGSS